MHFTAFKALSSLFCSTLSSGTLYTAKVTVGSPPRLSFHSWLERPILSNWPLKMKFWILDRVMPRGTLGVLRSWSVIMICRPGRCDVREKARKAFACLPFHWQKEGHAFWLCIKTIPSQPRLYLWPGYAASMHISALYKRRAHSHRHCAKY